MNLKLSLNTQAILLLTAPLIAGKGKTSPDQLTPSEYKRLVRHLREMRCQPADFLSIGNHELLRNCHSIIDKERLQRLLDRGFLLSQVIERWQTRAIWVVSRADADYPRRLKANLREDTPPVLYGCGDTSLLETGGLAVVGSRHVDESLIEYTIEIGCLSARAGKTVISGGAKGIDQAAIRGALDAGGKASNILADSLEKIAMNREHRNLLMNGQLVLISPYDPNSGFNVGNAMQRNKLIYALADAALVVNADFNKGGTWAGATEQLEKLRLVSVYVRSTGEIGKGLEALRQKGAIPWPNPQDLEDFISLFNTALQGNEAIASLRPSFPPQEPIPSTPASTPPQSLIEPEGQLIQSVTEPALDSAEILFAAVRNVIKQLLAKAKKEGDVASELQVSKSQAKAWLQRLVDEGVLNKLKKPVRYVVNPSLFE